MREKRQAAAKKASKKTEKQLKEGKEPKLNVKSDITYNVPSGNPFVTLAAHP